MTPDADPPEVEVTLPRAPAFKGSPSAPGSCQSHTSDTSGGRRADSGGYQLPSSSLVPAPPFHYLPFYLWVIIVIILVVSVSPTRCLSPFLTSTYADASLSLLVSLTLSLALLFSLTHGLSHLISCFPPHAMVLSLFFVLTVSSSFPHAHVVSRSYSLSLSRNSCLCHSLSLSPSLVIPLTSQLSSWKPLACCHCASERGRRREWV